MRAVGEQSAADGGEHRVSHAHSVAPPQQKSPVAISRAAEASSALPGPEQPSLTKLRHYRTPEELERLRR